MTNAERFGASCIHEDELPESISDELYRRWFDLSWLSDGGIGVRVGPALECLAPVRLQRSRAKDADNSSPNGLEVQYVGRPGKWGNPFNWRTCPRDAGPPEWAKGAAVDLFKQWLCEGKDSGPFLNLPDPPSLAQARVELRNKNLSCWCRLCDRHRLTGLPLGVDCPDCDPCHASVLLEIANGGGGVEMPRKTTATRHQLVNARYPKVDILWTEDEGTWTGRIQVWKDGNTKAGRDFQVALNPTGLIGHIFTSIESFGAGCWATATVPVPEVTARDLVWCGEWAIAELKRHPEWPTDELQEPTP